jgi:TP53 regulating kinase-like protein
MILKYRFPKTYRHPTLNSSLTRTRLSFESRALTRAQRAGVVVPGVLWVDERYGVIGLEWIDGWSVREVLGGGAEGELEYSEEEGMEGEDVDAGFEGSGVEMEVVESEGMKELKKLGVGVGE